MNAQTTWVIMYSHEGKQLRVIECATRHIAGVFVKHNLRYGFPCLKVAIKKPPTRADDE